MINLVKNSGTPLNITQTSTSYTNIIHDQRLLSQLLTKMDGIMSYNNGITTTTNVLVVAATRTANQSQYRVQLAVQAISLSPMIQ